MRVSKYLQQYCRYLYLHITKLYLSLLIPDQRKSRLFKITINSWLWRKITRYGSLRAPRDNVGEIVKCRWNCFQIEVDTARTRVNLEETWTWLSVALQPETRKWKPETLCAGLQMAQWKPWYIVSSRDMRRYIIENVSNKNIWWLSSGLHR